MNRPTKEDRMKDLIENWNQAEFWLTYHKVVVHDAFGNFYDIAKALGYNPTYEDNKTTVWLQGTIDFVDGLVELWVYSRNHIISIGDWINR